MILMQVPIQENAIELDTMGKGKKSCKKMQASFGQ